MSMDEHRMSAVARGHRVSPHTAVERVAVSLLQQHGRMMAAYRKGTSPKYLTQVYAEANRAAQEVIHQAGYGNTPAHLSGVVSDVYNETSAAHDTLNTVNIVSKGWPLLAERLAAIHRGDS